MSGATYGVRTERLELDATSGGNIWRAHTGSQEEDATSAGHFGCGKRHRERSRGRGGRHIGWLQLEATAGGNNRRAHWEVTEEAASVGHFAKYLLYVTVQYIHTVAYETKHNEHSH